MNAILHPYVRFLMVQPIFAACLSKTIKNILKSIEKNNGIMHALGIKIRLLQLNQLDVGNSKPGASRKKSDNRCC